MDKRLTQAPVKSILILLQKTWVTIEEIGTYNGNNAHPVTAIIPNGNYYKFIQTSGSSTSYISRWAELR